MKQFYVYILASRPSGALYVGVTNNLVRRVYEHKKKLTGGHTKRYRIDKLVQLGFYETAYQAIQREKISNTGREFGRLGLSQKKMIHGAICTMKSHIRNQLIEMAGTSPAMTAQGPE